MNILCVCGNGMGTSTILKVTLNKLCKQHGIDANIESCAFSEAAANMFNTDLIITSPEWANMLPSSNAVVAVTKNLIDVAGVEKALVDAVNEHFPDQIKK